MNTVSNIWNHPKTSAAGLLIAVVTVAGVLSQQGVTLGNLGTGTVVSLIAPWPPRCSAWSRRIPAPPHPLPAQALPPPGSAAGR